eukprot:152747-Prorocentrum_minimum.AAC.3
MRCWGLCRCRDDLLLILVTNDLVAEESSLRKLLEVNLPSFLVPFVRHDLSPKPYLRMNPHLVVSPAPPQAVLNGMVLMLGESALFGPSTSHKRKRALVRAMPLMDTICREDGAPLGLPLGCVEMHPADFEGAGNRKEIAKALQV